MARTIKFFQEKLFNYRFVASSVMEAPGIGCEQEREREGAASKQAKMCLHSSLSLNVFSTEIRFQLRFVAFEK